MAGGKLWGAVVVALAAVPLASCSSGTPAVTASTTTVAKVDKATYVEKVNALCTGFAQQLATIEAGIPGLVPLPTDAASEAANASFKAKASPVAAKLRDDVKAVGTPAPDPGIGPQVTAKLDKLVDDVNTLGYAALVPRPHALDDKVLHDYGLSACFADPPPLVTIAGGAIT